MDILNQSLEELINAGGFDCACGRHHSCGLKYLKIGPGAVQYLVDALKAAGGTKAFIICDKHTEAAAWAKAEPVLAAAKFPYKKFVFPMEHVQPDEYAVGSCLMAFDPSCDVILGIGSGVVNDCCKVLAHAVGCRSVILGTAPSMDGYASNSASMIQNRVKVSLSTGCPVAIIADTAIMKDAGYAHMGVGVADGKDKAEQAARAAIESPLLETSINGAHGVLINITGSADMGLEDVEAAASLVQEAAHPDANIIFGATFDDAMEDQIRVTVIATGFEDSKTAAKPAGVEAKAEELFSAASGMAAEAAKPAEAPKAEERGTDTEEDPFDSIFKIFNSK